jgi:hypothetical protein
MVFFRIALKWLHLFGSTPRIYLRLSVISFWLFEEVELLPGQVMDSHLSLTVHMIIFFEKKRKKVYMIMLYTCFLLLLE